MTNMDLLADNDGRYFQASRFFDTRYKNIVLQTVGQLQVYVHSMSDSIRISRYLSQLVPHIVYLCKTTLVFKIRHG